MITIDVLKLLKGPTIGLEFDLKFGLQTKRCVIVDVFKSDNNEVIYKVEELANKNRFFYVKDNKICLIL